MTNSEIINRYIQAFNNKDVEGCFKYLADDLTVLKLPDEQIHLESKAKAKQHYLSSIQDGTFLPITLISEMALGEYITVLIDKTDGKESRKAIVINYFKNGLISKMWMAPQ
jgi:hypothetical protein